MQRQRHWTLDIQHTAHIASFCAPYPRLIIDTVAGHTLDRHVWLRPQLRLVALLLLL